ncbi:hypothetical protein ABFS82_10G131800 [Erythranthe guttata]|uniref:Transmembrane protein n=1 Tax=Erythranthe guttata TaxID=4155 RepID=A0A022RRV9_ERYGU|nr:PREDICTED: uncharacterized protein LOC105952266 [Erythranthe guttata]EYU42468.1 hypothetical protein MIMGU_mgv1a022693mg [Erythranthe guttata]|eukprot:XP_012831254.1 PREDICTED: uncharacterized protein LOC105952266 [Erythranthe guttata]
MEDFSEIFDFLIIIKETLKILPRNGKKMASIAVLSLLLPSTLFLLNINLSPHVLKYNNALGSAVHALSFMLTYFIISHLLSTAAILVSAFSYTDRTLTSKDLFSSIERRWKNIPFSRRIFLLGGYISSYSLPMVFVVLALLVALAHHNFIAIALWINTFILQLYSSVVTALSVVVSVVEDSSSVEGLKKAEKLVMGGQRLHGFMLNLFLNLVALILVLSGFYYNNDKLSVDDVAFYYGCLFLNLFSLSNVVVFTVYTVFYFRCKKHHGEEEEEIDVFGEYTELPTFRY